MPPRTRQRSLKERKHFLLQEYEGQTLATPIPIYLPEDVEEEDLWGVEIPNDPKAYPGFPPFKDWLSKTLHNFALQKEKAHTFHSHPYEIKKIDVQSADWFLPKDSEGKYGRIGFMKIQARVENDKVDEEGKKEWIPGAIFLRGGSVGILFIIEPYDPEHPEKQHPKSVVLTIQPRIAAGSLAFAEIPAGMLDGSGDFTSKAADEIEEEVGIKINKRDLFDMSAAAVSHVAQKPWKSSTSSAAAPKTDAGVGISEVVQNSMYPSVGGCDEFIPLLLCQKRLELDKMEELKGKATGLRNEGERITLKLVELKDLWKEGGRDAKALAALALYEGLKSEGRLPDMPDKPDDPEEAS